MAVSVVLSFFFFIQNNRKIIRRTAFRYGIELMPKELKEKAMKKDWIHCCARVDNSPPLFKAPT